MNNDNKIGHREALALLTVMISGKVFLSFPRDMALLGDAAGWVIVLLSGLLSLIGFYFIYNLLKKYPSKNIIEIAQELTGPWIGTLMGLVIFLFFLIISSLMLRMFAETFILAILPRTPISIVTILFLGLIIYGTLLGIETISRVAWFYGPYLLIALITIMLFCLPQAKLIFLTPILGPGVLPILKNSVLYSSMFAEILLLGIIAPLIRKKQKIYGIGLYSILISIFINLSVTVVVVVVFNYIAAATLIFPIFQLARLISFGEFIQRVESIFVFLWFFTAGIQLGGLYYGTVVSFSETFKIKNYRPLVFPVGILVFSLSLLPSSMTETVKINDFMVNRFYAIVAFTLPLLLWLISVIFKKKSRGKND